MDELLEAVEMYFEAFKTWKHWRDAPNTQSKRDKLEELNDARERMRQALLKADHIRFHRTLSKQAGEA